ncbi:MAG: GNAT family N-acetyltransferase [Bacteroidaceae bacterium]|nr:GNAT family N-acetyltransferase [Bacteroidaceae bacterium]
MEPEDLELVYHIENDAKLWPWSATNVPISRYTVRQYLEAQKGNIYEDGELRLAIEYEGKAVGIVDLTNFSPQHLRAEVGLVVLSEYHHKGIGCETLRLLHDYASQHLRMRSLYAFIAKDNLPAQALLRSLGYIERAHLNRWIRGEGEAVLYQILLDR